MKSCSELEKAEKRTWASHILGQCPNHVLDWQVFPFQLYFCFPVTIEKFWFYSSAKQKQFTNFESYHETGLLSHKPALFKNFTHRLNETI